MKGTYVVYATRSKPVMLVLVDNKTSHTEDDAAVCTTRHVIHTETTYTQTEREKEREATGTHE